MENVDDGVGDRPEITAVIPTYNYGRFVCEAVQSAIRQQGVSAEIIVVDDGSTDDTLPRLRPYFERVRYIYQENQGLAAARNTGVRAAQGDYVAFLDADDIWRPNKLARQMELLRASDIDLCFSDAVSFGESVDRHFSMCCSVYRCERERITHNGFRFKEQSTEPLLRENFIRASSVVAKAALLRQIWSDVSLPRWQDLDLWLRLSRCAVFGFVDAVLVECRHHFSSISSDKGPVALSASRMIRKFEKGQYGCHTKATRRNVTARWGERVFLHDLAVGDWGAALNSFQMVMRNPDPERLARVLRSGLRRHPWARSLAVLPRFLLL